MSKPLMISVSGIRGIVGEGLSPEIIIKFTAAAGMVYGPGRVMVGRDSRVTGEMVKHAVISGLLAVGCHPVDLGICATPTVELAVINSNAVGGIMVTASHNPAQWNALKLIGSGGMFLDPEEGERVKKIVESEDFAWKPWNQIGRIESYAQATEDHVNHILGLSVLNADRIRKRQFRVAFDCVNGAGGLIVPKLLKALGCDLFPLNEEPSGLFAHNPEPVPQNLKDLSEHVKKSKVNVGFAVDPDVDRLAVVNEKGEPVGEEYTLALAVQHILSKNRGPVVVNLSTSRVIDDIAAEHDVEVVRTKVGEIHVSTRMKEINAVIGGEGNGGVILPENLFGRDAMIAMSLILQAMSESDKPISEIWQNLPQYAMSKKKIEIGSQDADVMIKRLEQKYQHEKLNLIDGLKIEWPKSWVQIRKSNTEPIIRIMAEAGSPQEAESLCDRFVSEIKMD